MAYFVNMAYFVSMAYFVTPLNSATLNSSRGKTEETKTKLKLITFKQLSHIILSLAIFNELTVKTLSPPKF